MRAGWTISIALHAAGIAAGLFAIPYDDDRLRDVSRVTEVSLVTATPADRDQAPDVQNMEVAGITAPSFDPDAGPAPEDDIAPEMSEQDFIEDPSARDAAADLSALIEELAQPEVSVSVDAPPEDTAPDSQMSSLSLPGTSGFDTMTSAPRGPALATPPAPRQAPRIASATAPTPPMPDRSDREEQATVPDDAPSETTETAESAAPEEATTAISPNPESGEADGSQLRLSTAPRARPRNFEAQALAAAEAARVEEAAGLAEQEAARRAEAEAQAARDAEQTPAPAETATETAQSGEPAGAPDTPVGPPLSVGEKDALRLAVQRCWNIPAGLENASDLRVVVAVELDPSGRIIGAPRLIEPASADRREIVAAFDAARRALLRCQQGGYDLPRDKYEHWKNLEVAFDPKGMLARW
ncbi:hypothetical protein [Oceanibium sediminis]|uniref:hypothetical protein n=1 Tax=Oceanibium sediminis TaxID=2026339 RepID=UPI001300A49B|nr:hypothetical protein [Oceanibium sediminis]